MWHATHDHVDLYLPRGAGNASAFSSHKLQYTDHVLPKVLLQPSQPSLAYWNLSSLSNSTFHEAYRPLEDIHTFTSELLELYPDNVRVVPIGHSAENREMFALEIAKDRRSVGKMAGFVISGAQHAREVCIFF